MVISTSALITTGCFLVGDAPVEDLPPKLDPVLTTGQNAVEYIPTAYFLLLNHPDTRAISTLRSVPVNLAARGVTIVISHQQRLTT
jgi:hypothetical protein